MLEWHLPMKIAIAADHAGFSLKESVRAWLAEHGYQVEDLGPDGPESTDYPDYAHAVAHRVASGAADRGVLVCHTGIGMSIAANKVPGIRAAVAMNEEAVRLTRSHNDANVLALGALFTGAPDIERLLQAFLGTEFDGGERHVRRIGKIAKLEKKPLEEQKATV
jgi:ribose 5-phosphate isomerase B